MGARLTSNYFMLDGTDIIDSQNFTPGGAGGQLFGVESIQEFQVLTHNQSGQYGRSMGGIINSVTRSGGNAINGSGYEFLRNSALDAPGIFLMILTRQSQRSSAINSAAHWLARSALTMPFSLPMRTSWRQLRTPAASSITTAGPSAAPEQLRRHQRLRARFNLA